MHDTHLRSGHTPASTHNKYLIVAVNNNFTGKNMVIAAMPSTHTAHLSVNVYTV